MAGRGLQLPPGGDGPRARQRTDPMAMHYPRRTSNVKRRRKLGFRARMKTKSGRKLINKRRRIGRTINSK